MMPDGENVIEQIKAHGLLPLYFHRNKETCIEIMNALYKAGVRIVEFTNRGDEALENFVAMRKLRDSEMPDLLLGAGTIKTVANAHDFIEAGADFVISPGLNEEVGKVCATAGVFWVPGCMTPSEIMRAEASGAKLVKLFPGNLLGPGFVDAIRELFPKLAFIPTGGVAIETENLTAWFRSGVIGVGAGSNVINKSAVQKGDYEAIQKSIKAATKIIEQVRSSIFPNH